MILGIDEVGRGPWAGPVVVGAVVLGDQPIEGLTDSKKLTKKRREALDALIRAKASVGLGWVSPAEIDEIGLGPALKLATIRAVEGVKGAYHEIIIDGTINFLKETTKGRYVTTMAKADLLIPSVSAASIVAKVARDNYMAEQALVYPGYGFERHVGYGTAAHQQAIQKLGLTPLHRRSFKPVALHVARTTKTIGDEAEQLVEQKLRQDGFEIIERNWKTKYCEIDIIAKKANSQYFIEVKYRRNDLHGGGLAAITTKKLRQMRFAVELYLNSHQNKETPVKLAVISVSGTPMKVGEVLELE